VYDRLIDFVYDRPELVTNGGNFEDYEDICLMGQKEKWMELHNNRRNIHFQKLYKKDTSGNYINLQPTEPMEWMMLTSV
jgi:hypothetical protein